VRVASNLRAEKGTVYACERRAEATNYHAEEIAGR
jgi:hypothetical protein